MQKRVLKVFLGGYVDDSIHGGDQDFGKLAKKTKIWFETAEDQTTRCMLTSSTIPRERESNSKSWQN